MTLLLLFLLVDRIFYFLSILLLRLTLEVKGLRYYQETPESRNEYI